MQSHVITWKGFSYLFKFLSSFFLILGHSGELTNVTRVYNGKPDSLHQSSFEYGWSMRTEVKKKKGTRNICGRFNFFYLIFLFRFTGLSGRLIQTVPTLT